MELNELLPVATAHDEVWVFVQFTIGLVGVGRLGYSPESGVIGIFPTDLFAVNTIVPVNQHTGEPWSDIRWATTHDVDNYLGFTYVLAC